MSLRKYIALIAAVLLLFSCGCNKESGNVNSGIIEEFIYGQAGDAILMAAAGDVLYTLENGEGAVFSAFDANGNRTASTVIPEFNANEVKCICANENKIYAVIDTLRSFLVCSVDIGSGAADTICELDELDNIEKVEVCGNRLYWLGEHRSEAKPVEPFTNEEGVQIYFSDTGKKMGSIDLESGENVFSEIDFPVSFSVLDGKVTVYAFDSGGGYYFTDYAAPNEKNFTNKLGLITNFDFFKKSGEFAFVGSNDFTGVLPVSRADGESGVIRAVSGVYPFLTSELCASEAGYVWLRTADSALSFEKRIKRYDLRDTVVKGDPIRVISSQYFTEQPFAAGSEIQMNQLSGEGFALTVLSLDKSYDAAMISSDQSVAHDIKEKGSFYPLNYVQGVSEYLDRCFPYIKEAVTDSEGNIRMLPIAVEIPLIAYNEKNCSENSIALSTELEPFIRAAERASTVSEYYDCTRYQLVQTQLIGYLSGNRSFDTEEFRQLAILLKEQCTDNIFKGNYELYSALMTMQNGVEEPYYASIYEKTLFTQLLYRIQQIVLINDENLRAVPLPLSGNGKSVAVCTFLCVNPYSDRLSETLGYIENTVTAMYSERNSCMLSDQSTYENTAFAQDIYSIYQNGEICFQIPSEIYAEDFERYCAGEIALDEFISEADRKLSTYLDE
ncbi:MAG: hypothetical protein HDR72_04875 [Ruminococcaceae bacterium]|nr:hypothetical protein [Oscillospiraceae bacterium]